MASTYKLLWVALLLAVTMPRVVRPAPTGLQDHPEAEAASEEFREAVEEAGKLDDEGAVEKSLEEDKEIGEVEDLPDPGEEPEALEDEEEEIVEEEGVDDDDATAEDVIEDFKDEAISDDGFIGDEITGSSSEPDATDYLWEPSFNYDSGGDSDLNPWFLYDLPVDPTQWSSNADIFEEESSPYYESSYDSINEAETNNPDNSLEFDTPEGVFDGIPGEELNNKVDQTVDEVLCLLGLCNDARVYPEDENWEEPNEIQFTEEGMIGYNHGNEELDEKDPNPVDDQLEEVNDEAMNTSAEVNDENDSSHVDGGRHRSKRDLSWDELERDNDLLENINALEEETDLNRGSTAADRFEELLQYFKEEAAENGNKDKLYLGVPEELFDGLDADEIGTEFQYGIGGGEEGDEDEEDGIEEAGEFTDDGEDEGEGEADEKWGAYVVPGSPYSEDTLKYDGYKRDDEREALKVYIESLQNVEGYRKRSDQGEDDSHSVTSFLRQLVPRSPPNAIRYPKTGLEPFAREKYFPLFAETENMSDDDDIAYPDPDIVLQKYNELMELLNTEMEAASLISTIEDMAAELGRDQELLQELEEVQADEGLEIPRGENNWDLFDLVDLENGNPVKRSPHVVDYPDFNEYPPEFHRSAPAAGSDEVSEEELMKLYSKYLNGAEDEGEWGDVYEPRERREGEDTLPGPHGGYYVQGRMMSKLMNPKRDWEEPIDSDDQLMEDLLAEESDHPYVLLEPADLGYDEWPGGFDIFYDTRDGTFVVYPDPEPNETPLISREALLDALGLPSRNFVDDEDEIEEVQEDGRWADFKDDGDVRLEDLEEINADFDQLEDLSQLMKIAEEMKYNEEKAAEEASLLGAFLGK